MCLDVKIFCKYNNLYFTQVNFENFFFVAALEDACVAARELAFQTAFYHVVDAVVDAFNLDVIAYLRCESVHQEHSRVGFLDAALAHVEHRILVELSGGCAVRTFHVVGINLKERHGVDLRLVGEDDVAVVLIGIGLLSVWRHHNMTVEHCRSLVVKDALELLVAAAVRHVMVDFHQVFDVLFLVEEIQTVNLQVSALAVEVNVDVVFHKTSVKRHQHEVHAAVGGLLDVDVRREIRVVVEVLNPVQLERGVLLHHDVALFLVRLQMTAVVQDYELTTLILSDRYVIFEISHRRKC